MGRRSRLMADERMEVVLQLLRRGIRVCELSTERESVSRRCIDDEMSRHPRWTRRWLLRCWM